MVTATGVAHPVTHDLPGANADGKPPTWGGWFRMIGAQKVSGETVMSGPEDTPLLVLDHVGKGRVAELLSDQAWLWARGFEGGGPEAELLRRLAHWLMKEPELEEERLSATIANGAIAIERHTMAETAKPVTLTMPSGTKQTLDLKEIEPGSWRATAKADELGLYRLTDGTLSAVAAAGPLNPKEVADMRATDPILKPLAQTTGGSVHWLADGGVPKIRRVAPGGIAWGEDWIGLRANGAYRVTSRGAAPAAAGMAGAGVAAGHGAGRLAGGRALGSPAREACIMIIDEAVLADIADIHRVRLSVRENVLADPSRVTDADIARVIANTGKGWVCRIDGTIRGFSFADGQTRNIWALFIEPGFERRGVGRRLHDLAVGWLFERSAEPIWLTTEPGTRAEGFYRAAGWRAGEVEANGDRRFELAREDWRQR